MPNPTETLGTGETYTTIQAWEDALDNSQQHTGECKAEVFSSVLFDGVVNTATEYPHLTAQSGAEHDGRAHEVSAVGNARIEVSGALIVARIEDGHIRVSWLEIKGPGNNAYAAISLSVTLGVVTGYVRHCIIHNNHASSSTENYGLYPLGVAANQYFYRNIVYGFGSSGIRLDSGRAGSVALCNTFFSCNSGSSSFHAGLRTVDTDYLIQNNACFDNPNLDIRGTAGTLDYNATSDTTGDDEGANGIANLTTANQFVAPTTTWADTDLLVKEGADIIGEGNSFSAETYLEIDVAIDKGATRATITGNWDIGAAQFGAAVPEPTTLTPNAIALPAVVPVVAIIMTLLTSAVAAPVVVPTAVVNQVLSPSAIVIPAAVPTVGVNQVLSPSAVVVPAVAPAVGVNQALSPSSIAIPAVIPTAAVNQSLIVDSVVLPGSVPAVGVNQSLTVDPVVLSATVPTAAIGDIYFIMPDAVAISSAVPAATNTMTLLASPVAIPVVVPAASIRGLRTLSPDAVVMSASVPTAGVNQSLIVDPVVVPVVVPAAAVGRAAITPDAVVMPVVIPAATIGYTIMPNAVAMPLAVPTADIRGGLVSYTLNIGISLGSNYVDKTLNAQFVDNEGEDTGDPITTGFNHIANGHYMFHYSSWPDRFRGGLKIFENGETDILAFTAINPEEVEYCNADVSLQFSATNILIADAKDKVDVVIAQTDKLRFTGGTGSEEIYASATVNTDSLATAVALATVDGIVDDIKVKTDQLQFSGSAGNELIYSLADVSASGLALAADLATVDTIVDAIKVQTDLFTFTGDDVKATLDGEEVVTDSASRTASKADVSALATASNLAAVPTVGEIDTELTSNHGSGLWLRDAGAGDTLDTVHTTDGTDPIPGVSVRVTSDEAGTTLIASGITDADGDIDFYHDLAPGTTVYVWRSASGWSFDNPDTEVIS